VVLVVGIDHYAISFWMNFRPPLRCRLSSDWWVARVGFGNFQRRESGGLSVGLPSMNRRFYVDDAPIKSRSSRIMLMRKSVACNVIDGDSAWYHVIPGGEG
jgi:hypothetical protein